MLVSVKLVYLSTNALLIRKIKDQAKPHQIRSDLIKPNIGFGEEKFDPYQLLWWSKFQYSCNSFSIYLFITIIFFWRCLSDPTHPPRSFRFESISADTLNLTWDSIPEEHHNGRVIGYTIWYRAGCEYNYMSPEVRINVSVSTTSYTLTGLQPGTKYDLRIAGFTAAGIGHYEHRDFFTS